MHTALSPGLLFQEFREPIRRERQKAEAASHVQVYCLKALRAIESGHGIDPTYRDYKPDDPAVKALLTRDISSAMKDPYKAAVEDCLIITMKVRRGLFSRVPCWRELRLGLHRVHAGHAAFGGCKAHLHLCRELHLERILGV